MDADSSGGGGRQQQQQRARVDGQPSEPRPLPPKDLTKQWSCLGWQRRGGGLMPDEGLPHSGQGRHEGARYVPLRDEVKEFVQRCFEDRMLGKLQVDWWSTSAEEAEGSSVYSQAMQGPVGRWSIKEVGAWLRGIGLEEYAEEFKQEEVDGVALLGMLEIELLDNCCVEDDRARRFLMKQIARLHMHSTFPDCEAGAFPLSESGAATAKAMRDFGYGAGEFGRFVACSACIDGPGPQAPGGPQSVTR